ncbi:hypothetical protein GCM10010406_39940 [Streptomyces thermolineatus]|uniref:Uncharacterized protein n=1 Tax=Streptomyces thermolineatus TaxID=44033 RepID=A0ABP5ZMC7_9ACTN
MFRRPHAGKTCGRRNAVRREAVPDPDPDPQNPTEQNDRVRPGDSRGALEGQTQTTGGTAA